MVDCLKVISIILMVIHILQWKARSVIADGREFKKGVADLKVVPNVKSNLVTCGQWLKR